MTKNEALKMALKFVEDSECGTADLEAHIKEALAQRTWVEIDDKDYIKAYELCDFDKDAAFEFFEAKLKEKNS